MPEPAPAADDLDALVRRVDPERWLSSRFIAEPERRADVVALYAYDHELARAPKIASNPLLGEIRLTWWREALDEIFEGRPVRRHPTAQALAEVVRRRDLARAPLEAMIDARYRELDPEPLREAEAADWAQDVAGGAAWAAAAVLGAPGAPVRAAAAAWALSWRIAEQPELKAACERLLQQGRREAAKLSPQTFPAVAHAVFAKARLGGRAAPGGLGAQLRITLAVARGRI